MVVKAVGITANGDQYVVWGNGWADALEKLDAYGLDFECVTAEKTNVRAIRQGREGKAAHDVNHVISERMRR